MQLIISEKPSLGIAIAKALGITAKPKGGFIETNSETGYLISWCAGHLLELAAPNFYDEKYAKWRYEDLPIVPEKWQYVPAKDKVTQLEILVNLMNRPDVDSVINACDAGREGELIFRHVYNYAKCNKPVFRLWISSMEEYAIKKGFDDLKDGAEYDKLCKAALCREQADWLVGLNASRLFSVLYGVTLNTGRVQSPTLAMIVKREAEIENFVKEPYYTPILDLSGFAATGEKQKDKIAAETIAENCNAKSAVVTNIERVKKTIAPPKLYDLTTLQREANRIYGFTAQQTLDYVQSQYEKQMLTYPRTDSRHITADMRGTVSELLTGIDFDPNIYALVGNVSDHHALLPTVQSLTADLSAIPSGERAVYELVSKRLVAAVSPKHVYEAVTVTFDCGGNTFTAKGKVVIEPGWQTESYSANESKNESKIQDESKDKNESETFELSMPSKLSKNQTFDSVKVTVKEGWSQPKKHHTEDTILSAMETAGATGMPDEAERRGLGTSATRAATLEKLIKSGFVERQKKNLIPTDKGKNLIAILPTSLTSAKLTADWEQKLKQIENGEISANEFMSGITAFTKAIVLDNNKPKPEFASLFPNARKPAPSLGKCLRCGGEVTEWEKGFSCDNNKNCGFRLWKESKFWAAKKKPLTAEIVSVLLKDGRVKLKNLYSEKTGKTYRATVILEDTGGEFVNFRMEFDNSRR
ncbi:DNA topoisomerase [Clostridia bacterium]|nr:DNA topoisomerase [Clostridia bacterium]